MSSIKLKVTKADKDFDLRKSHFLGSPVLPEEWLEEFDDSILFLFQLNLEEIKDLDEDNLLPHQGFLYFFLDTSKGLYELEPKVKYYNGEPLCVVDDFNQIVPEYEKYIDTYRVNFSLEDDYCDGIKLFGEPSDWNYMEEHPQLLLQFDPLDSEMGIFDILDGYLYFFFDEDNLEVSLFEEYS